MKSNMKCRAGVSLVFVALMSAGFGVDAHAQAQVVEGCFTGPAKLSDNDVSAFTGAPGAFLTANPVGGLPMTTQVRALAGSSAAALDDLIALVSQTNSSQKASLGAGLARAAKSCQSASPDYAQLIQQKVAAVNDKDLTAAFLADLSDVQTAALGGAGNGGGAAAGIAGGGAAGDGGSTGGDSSTPSLSATFSIGTRAAFTRNSSQTITIISNPGT